LLGHSRMSDKPAPANDAQHEAAPKKGGIKIIIIAAVAVVLLGGAGGAFWWMRRAAPQVEAAPPEPKPAERGVVPFDPFVVNLADTGGSRYLRISVQLVVPSAEEAEKVHKTAALLMQARSAILEQLTQQTSDVIATAEGKAHLKDAIKEHTKDALGEIKVIDVLFSDFVIQY
jgi:flagellar FliL protein